VKFPRPTQPYLPTATGWVYLAVVLDLFGRKVVGWSIGPFVSNWALATELVSDAYQQTLRTLGIECSMSRTGNCYDNAVMERFFWSLKHEWTKHESFDNLEEARLSVFKYIETFYNRERIHQTLGYKSPDQYEAEYASAIAA